MITVIANESVIADLINQEFEDMLRSYEWEQENKWELEAQKALRELKASMRKYYLTVLSLFLDYQFPIVSKHSIQVAKTECVLHQ